MTEETDEQRQARIDMAVTRQLERCLEKNAELTRDLRKMKARVEELQERLKQHGKT